MLLSTLYRYINTNMYIIYDEIYSSRKHNAVRIVLVHKTVIYVHTFPSVPARAQSQYEIY